jgi:hypothetical protein
MHPFDVFHVGGCVIFLIFTDDLLSCRKYMGCVAFANFYFPGFLIPFGLTSNILSTM